MSSGLWRWIGVAVLWSGLVALPARAVQTGRLVTVRDLVAQQPSAVGDAPYALEQWTKDEGLPVDAVQALAQTTDGYLWVGTHGGLARFDGIDFTTYTTANTPALRNNRITGLAATPDGRLWVEVGVRTLLVRTPEGTFEAVGAAYGLDGQLTRMHLDESSGTLWVVTTEGLYRWRPGRARFMRLLRYQDLGRLGSSGYALEGVIDNVELDPHTGTVWMNFRRQGLISLAADGRLDVIGPQDGLTVPRVVTMHIGTDGGLTVGTIEGAFERDAEGHFRRVRGHELARSSRVLSIDEDGEGRRWLFMNDGVSVEEDGRFYMHSSEFEGWYGQVLVTEDGTAWTATPQRLLRNGQPFLDLEAAVYDMLEDREGNLWVGTERGGLLRIKAVPFQTMSVREGLPSRNAYVVYQSADEAVWVGTTQGLARVDPSGEVRTYRLRDDGLPASVQSIVEDAEGRLWVGVRGYGLCQLLRDAAPDEHACLRTEIDGPWEDSVAEPRALLAGPDGVLWMGTWREGLYRRDPNGIWTAFSGEDMGLSEGAALVQHLYRDRSGALWIGTAGHGLLRYRTDAGPGARFERLVAPPLDGEVPDGASALLPSDLVRSVYQDERGVFWIGTTGGGFVRLVLPEPEAPLSKATVTHVSQADGLFAGSVHCILPDGQGRLWMSSNEGLFWARRADLDAFAAGRVERVASVGYVERDGLRHREFNGGTQPACFQGHDGRMWFPSQDGVVAVAPDAILSASAPPPVRVQRLLAAGTDHLTAPRQAEVPLTLQPDERSFRIEFAALHLRAPERVRYRYRLDGYHQGWRDAGSRREASYTGVPPGRYTFRVQARSIDGLWKPVEAGLPLYVAPRWFETRWFFLASALVLGTLLALGVQHRLRRAQQREVELQHLVEERTRALAAERSRALTALREARKANHLKSTFLANMSHEIRTPLTSIIGFAEILGEEALGKTEREFAGLIERGGRRLMDTLTSVLDLAKIEAGEMEMRVQPVDLAYEVRRLGEELRVRAEASDVTLQIEAEEPLWVEADRSALFRVLTNLISNALKFAPHGIVRVRAYEAEGAPCLEVEDDGIGMDEAFLEDLWEAFRQESSGMGRAHEGSGLGLTITQQLVHLMGGHIDVESVKGQGTRFAIFLQPAAPPEDSETEPVCMPTSRKVVLVVDPDVRQRRRVAAVLAPRYRVLQVSSVEEALAEAPQQRFAAAVVAPRADDEPGSAAGLLRSVPTFARVPLLLIRPPDADSHPPPGFDGVLVGSFTLPRFEAVREGAMAASSA